MCSQSHKLSHCFIVLRCRRCRFIAHVFFIVIMFTLRSSTHVVRVYIIINSFFIINKRSEVSLLSINLACAIMFIISQEPWSTHLCRRNMLHKLWFTISITKAHYWSKQLSQSITYLKQTQYISYYHEYKHF